MSGLKVAFMPSVYKTELRVYLPSGESRGSVVVRIFEEERRELDAKFPSRSQSAGKYSQVEQVICDGITKEEREQIAKHLRVEPWTEIRLEVKTGAFLSAVDEEHPWFVMNGKAFWILPQQS
jgi:hypothetical protein